MPLFILSSLKQKKIYLYTIYVGILVCIGLQQSTASKKKKKLYDLCDKKKNIKKKYFPSIVIKIGTYFSFIVIDSIISKKV